MTAIPLFDALKRDAAPRNPPEQIGWLAQKLVDASLADFDRLLEYESHLGSSAADQPEANTDIGTSLYELFKQWALEAEQVLSRTRQLAQTGLQIHEVEKLEDAFGRVRARLQLTPRIIARARQQVANGEAIPMKELRNDLHARVRAGR